MNFFAPGWQWIGDALPGRFAINDLLNEEVPDVNLHMRTVFYRGVLYQYRVSLFGHTVTIIQPDGNRFSHTMHPNRPIPDWMWEIGHDDPEFFLRHNLLNAVRQVHGLIRPMPHALLLFCIVLMWAWFVLTTNIENKTKQHTYLGTLRKVTGGGAWIAMVWLVFYLL